MPRTTASTTPSTTSRTKLRATLAAAALVAAITAATLPAASAAPDAAPVAAPRTERVSVAADGTQTDGASELPDVSADGRYVVFSTEAKNLVPGDTDTWPDVYVRDLRRGTVERVSVQDSGAEFTDFVGQRPTISADGRYVTFAAVSYDADGHYYSGIYLRDLKKKRTELVSLSDADKPVTGESTTPAQTSADGRYVTFVSQLKENGDYVDGMNTGVYVRDRKKGTTKRISEIVTGPASSSYFIGQFTVSADGSHIGYSIGQQRPGLDSRTYIYDTKAGQGRRLDLTPSGADREVGVDSLSKDGRYGVFSARSGDLVPGDTNEKYDIFRIDLRTDVIERIVYDADGGQTDGTSTEPRITPDGRHVVFSSSASGLVADDPGHGSLYVRDLRTGKNQRVDVPQGGGDADSGVSHYALSADAGTVAFSSDATNLVSGDTNGVRDVFVRHPRQN
ncbi:TolB family protein [Streptomyces sp. NPDC055239]